MSKFFDAERQLNVLDYHVHQSTVTTSKLAHLVCAQQCIKMHTNATFIMIKLHKCLIRELYPLSRRLLSEEGDTPSHRSRPSPDSARFPKLISCMRN